MVMSELIIQLHMLTQSTWPKVVVMVTVEAYDVA